MGRDDWYRLTTWTKQNEEAFFAKLKRTQKFSRIQYLRIQATILTETRKPELLDAAEMLCNKILDEFPEGFHFKDEAYWVLGDIYLAKGNFNKALEYYRTSLKLDPKHQSPVYLTYCTLVVKLSKTDEYSYAESLLAQRVDYDPFPQIQYVICSLLSIINSHNGNIKEAEHFARRADEHADKERSGIPNHPHLGVVDQRDPDLDQLVRETLKRSNINNVG